MLIDSHAHLNADQFQDDLEEVIARALKTNLKRIVVIGFDQKTIEKAIELANQYDFIYAVIGWHPVDAIDCTQETLQWIEQLAAIKKVVAIGEIGLDYYWNKSPKDVQQELLRKQIRLAKKVNLPIVIHNREATEDLLKILKEEEAAEVGGIMHCFSGSVETAKKCIDMNFYISFAGPVTFKNAKQSKKVVAFVPIEKILIETDCPYLAPHPYRGKRNEPSYVKYVAEEIANIKGLSFDEVANTTTANAEKIFRL